VHAIEEGKFEVGAGVVEAVPAYNIRRRLPSASNPGAEAHNSQRRLLSAISSSAAPAEQDKPNKHREIVTLLQRSSFEPDGSHKFRPDPPRKSRAQFQIMVDRAVD
jgi:hypothetical protein